MTIHNSTLLWRRNAVEDVVTEVHRERIYPPACHPSPAAKRSRLSSVDGRLGGWARQHPEIADRIMCILAPPGIAVDEAALALSAAKGLAGLK
jgi:hypothetical protein